MKKISLFLATIMFFLAVAVMPGDLQEVQAFPSSESGDSWEKAQTYASAKAGAKLRFIGGYNYNNIDPYENNEIKAALCPVDNIDINAAVATWDVTDAKTIGTLYGGGNWVVFNTVVKLENDIPEGRYKKVLFSGNQVVSERTEDENNYVNQPVLGFKFNTINDDGYVYAYVYESDVDDYLNLNESTYPVLYDSDKKAELTTYSAFTTYTNVDGLRKGEKAYIYRLNLLDKSKTLYEENELGYHDGSTYYTIKNGILTNIRIDNGMGLSTLGSANDYEDFNGEKLSIVSPFTKDDTSSNEKPTTPSEDPKPGNDEQKPEEPKQDNTTNTVDTPNQNNTAATANTTLNPEFTVAALTSSLVPEVQASIDNLNRLVSEITGNTFDITNTLKAYAPDVDFSSITNGGTLDISEKNGVDISTGVQVTFTDDNIVANVTSKDTVIVLHVKHDGTIERFPAVAGDGTIKATFTSLSPVAWFKVSNAENTTAVSPKTGENFWSFLFH